MSDPTPARAADRNDDPDGHDQVDPGARAVGIATITLDGGQVLDTWYPAPALGSADATRATAVEYGLRRGSGTAELALGHA